MTSQLGGRPINESAGGHYIRRLTPPLPWTRPSSAGTASNKRSGKAFVIEFRSGMCLARTDHLRKSTPYLDPTSSSTTVPTSFRRFPTPEHGNVCRPWLAWAQTSPSSSNAIPDLAFWGSATVNSSRAGPEKTEPRDGELDFESTTDAEVKTTDGYRRSTTSYRVILKLWSRHDRHQVTKDDIFYYVYGLLHDPRLPHKNTPLTSRRCSRTSQHRDPR